MKRLLSILALLCCVTLGTAAQNLNAKADNIIGTYSGRHGDDDFKVKIDKLADGTYRGQVIWMARDKDAKGNKLLDKRNPDKSLRSRPADQVVLFSGLKYNAKEHNWGGTKIYDPQHGLKANLAVDFAPDGRLRLRGSVMGIGQTIYWVKIE